MELETTWILGHYGSVFSRTGPLCALSKCVKNETPNSGSQVTESKFNSQDKAVKKCSERNLCFQQPGWKWLLISSNDVGREFVVEFSTPGWKSPPVPLAPDHGACTRVSSLPSVLALLLTGHDLLWVVFISSFFRQPILPVSGCL